jgi:ligand-binding sensor domain-containing protein
VLNRIILICLLQIACVASGQHPYFQKLQTVNGLASDRVYSVMEDSKGQLWFGTDAGVSLFDGYSFKNLDNRRDLTANEVFNTYEDSKGRIWMLSQNGEISYYADGRLFSSKNVKAFRDIKINSDLTSVWERPNGDIVFSSLANGVHILDSNFKATQIQIQSVYRVWGTEKDGLLALGMGGVYSLKGNEAILIEPFTTDGHYARTAISNDTCFIAVGDQLYIYTDELTQIGELSSNEEVTFLSKTENTLLIGTRTGAYLNFSINAGKKNKRILVGSIVSGTVKDREGNLWVSTVGDGVYFSSSPEVKIYTTSSGLALNQISTVFKSSENAVWLGYRDGSFGVKQGSRITNDLNPTPTNEPVTEIKTNEYGELLILSKSYVTWIDSNSRHRYLRLLLNDLLFDSSYVYLASNRTYRIPKTEFYSSMSSSRDALGFLNQSYLESTIIPHRTKKLSTDSHGNLFSGTDHGLFVVNEGITIDLGKDTRGLNAFINDIVFDSKRGLTCVATRGEGIIILRGTSEVKRYTMNQNLSSNTCMAIDLDDEGQLWIGTNKGFDLIPDILSDEAVVRYGAKIGLRPTTVFDIVRVGDTLNMATNIGLMTFDLTTQVEEMPPAKPTITNIYVESRLTNLDTLNYQLNHNQNTIRFDFTTTTFKHMGDVTYKYMLEGYQEAWRSTKDRNIQFENLEPGIYKLNLKAVHNTGLASEGLSVEFTILKPLWKLWWFQLSAIAVFILLSILILSNRIKAWRSKLTLENRLSEVKIDKLQLEKAYLISEQKAGVMQMNPHFLFNSLNTIKGYYGQGKMKEANGFIGKFSKLLRKILESNKSLIPLQDEAEILSLYLELMHNRYDQVFDYEILNLVDEHINVMIPPMILQPIVENAVIHGLAPLNDGKITVTFEIFEDYLVCKVVDSGVGFSEEIQGQHNSVALTNIEDRLAILTKQYNKHCSLKIFSPVNGGKNPGTAVIVKLPLNI